jgi:hypothetical protein
MKTETNLSTNKLFLKNCIKKCIINAYLYRNFLFTLAGVEPKNETKLFLRINHSNFFEAVIHKKEN